MENHELLRRAEDLLDRCQRKGCVTVTGFLSPAERFQLETWGKKRVGCRLLFYGGQPDSERTLGFFLPEEQDAEAFEPKAYLRAMKLTAHFGRPGHRDYLGAVLGMGVGREWVGDILIDGETAWIFCLPSVLQHLLNLHQAGRVSVTAEEITPDAVPRMERRVEERSFTVQSTRLDAVLAGLFKLSRTEAARQIAAGSVSLNYSQSLKPDCLVHEGDVLSLRGMGKGKITGFGGASRKGRQFVYAELYL